MFESDPGEEAPPLPLAFTNALGRRLPGGGRGSPTRKPFEHSNTSTCPNALVCELESLGAFADPLYSDVYTIQISDNVRSASSGAPIDGDNNGSAGGNAVITLTHRCPPDMAAPYGEFDFFDVLAFGRQGIRWPA